MSLRADTLVPAVRVVDREGVGIRLRADSARGGEGFGLSAPGPRVRRSRGGLLVEEPHGLVGAVTPGAGSRARRRVAGASALATASALPSPETTNQTARVAVQRTERQADPLRRRLGGVGDRDGDRVVDIELAGSRGTATPRGRPARRPSITTSNPPEPRRAELVGVRRRRRPGQVRVAAVGGRHLVHPAGATHVGRAAIASAMPAGVAVGVVLGDVALVAPPEVDAAPVHVLVAPVAARTASWILHATVPPVSAIDGRPAGRPGWRPGAPPAARRPRPARASGDGKVSTSGSLMSASSWLSAPHGGRCWPAASRSRRRRRRGPGAAAPRQQLVEVAALERDRRSGAPGEESWPAGRRGG